MVQDDYGHGLGLKVRTWLPPDIRTIGENQGSRRPVSYTHLDVYKRQEDGREQFPGAGCALWGIVSCLHALGSTLVKHIYIYIYWKGAIVTVDMAFRQVPVGTTASWRLSSPLFPLWPAQ